MSVKRPNKQEIADEKTSRMELRHDSIIKMEHSRNEHGSVNAGYV